MSKKSKRPSNGQMGFASFPFDEFADMVCVNPSESDKLMRKLAKEYKSNKTKNNG